MDVFGGAPRFLAYPRPVVVQSGTDAALKCQIGGDPRPAVIWERNNKQIHPEGRYRLFEDGNVYNLIISGASMEDSGQYICKAKNSIGETYAAATLKVEGEAQEMELREENKPRFLIKPLSTRVGRGEDAVFSCKLWGNPRPEVVWEKDGKKLSEIFESTHFSVGYQDGGWFQLKIFKTRAPDGGVYTCKARNEFGEGLAGAVLLVDAGPGHEEESTRNGYANGHWKPHQSKQRGGRQVATRVKEDPLPSSAKVKMFAVTEGKHAKFRCFVTGKPKPEIIWRKDGRLILSGRRYLLYEDREGYFTLKVLYCKQQDNGVYVCAASNTAGQTLSAVHLSVKEPLVRFKQPLTDLEVWERDLAILECEVPEDSVPTTWYLEDRRLQPGAKYGMEEWGTKRRLTIRDIGADDDGIYLCEMADGGRSIAEVSVRGTIVRKLPRKVDVLEGENAAFCVEVEEEEMDIHWYKDGVELRETHQTILKSFGKTHILVFVNTSPQDSGMVTFIVGRSKTSSHLRVKSVRHSPPSCPINVQINLERANAALLSWVPAHDSRRNPPSGYVLERQEVGSQEWLQCLTTDSATSVEILGDSVPCEADYRFRICSVNKYGKSGHVDFPRAAHLVPVAKIQAPLQDALVPEGQDASFTIDLSASVIGTWFLNGTQIQDDDRFLMRRSRTHHSLRIRGVQEADNGAEITFIAYGVRDSAALYIQAPLVKFKPLSEMDRNKFIEVGNPIVLYCELSDPQAPVHWYKNGVELHTSDNLHIQSEGTMRRIVIPSAEFSHSGVYSCDAIDDVIRFNVEVEAPPVRFFSIPEVERNKSFEAGQPIVLQCELSDATAQVCWYKDGIELHSKTGIDIQSDGNMRTLIVRSADFIHSGVYTCKTKGDAIKFIVDIKAPLLRFTALSETEKNKSIEAGCPIVLQCELSDPTAQVCWYKDGSELHPHSGTDIQSEGSVRTLTVQSAEPLHSGLYSCQTKDDSVQFHVDIKESPPVALPLRFSAVPEVKKPKSVEPGCPIVLQHELSPPNAQVCGYEDGKELHPQAGIDNQTNGITRTVVVQTSEFSNSGTNNCETKDDAIQFNLDLQAPPVRFSSVPEAEKNKSIEAGQPIVLQCERSDPSVCWYTDGTQQLPKADLDIQSEGITRTLSVQSAELSHTGMYSCKTTDDDLHLNVEVAEKLPHSGECSCEISDDAVQSTVDNKAPPMTFSTIPEAEGQLKSIEAGNPIVLHCELSNPTAQVCWYKDGKQLHPQAGLEIQSVDSVRRLIIESASFFHSGVYSCDTADDVITFKVDVEAPSERFSAVPEVEKSKPIETDSPILWQCQPSAPHRQTEKDETKCRPQAELDIQSEDRMRRLAAQSELCHSQEYSCEVDDDLLTLKVDVKAPSTKFKVVPELERCTSVNVGCPIVLHCEVSDPTTQVSWYKNVTELLSKPGQDIKSEGTTRQLIIQSAELSHTGLYSCEAMDDAVQFNVNVKESIVPTLRFSAIPELEKNKSIEAGQPIDLQCELSDSSAQVCWYKDGMELQPKTGIDIQSNDNMRRLVIQSADFIHSGVYSCKTEGDAVEFNVDVKAPPVRFKDLSEAEKIKSIEEGCPIVLQCEISDPTAQVWWYKDGIELHPQVGIDIQSDGNIRKLTVQSAEMSHTGLYVCAVVEDDITFKVVVQAPLVKFSDVPEAQRHKYVKPGCPIILQCEVSDPSAQVQWYKDGIELYSKTGMNFQLEENIRKLTIDSAETSHSGVYKCVALDDVITFKVDVQAPPVKFSDVPEAQRHKCVKQGCPIILQCEISDSAAKVWWYKDGMQLHQKLGLDIQSDGNIRKLTVQSAEISHSGVYSCGAVDDAIAFKVDVQAPPVKFSDVPEAQRHKSVKPGCPIILQCEVSDPTAQVCWSKDGIELHPKTGINIQSEGTMRTLIIQSADICHSGVYSCNTMDDIIQFYVDIKAASPRFIELPEAERNKCVEAGSPITLQCVVTDASALVCWSKDGVELIPNKETDIQSDGTMRGVAIRSAELCHSGVYSCVLADDVMTFMLDVQAPPVKFSAVPEVERYKSVEAGQPIVLQCKLSDPTAQVKWYKDGIELSSQNGTDIQSDGSIRRLVIQSAQLSHSGEFSCDAVDDVIAFEVKVEGLAPGSVCVEFACSQATLVPSHIQRTCGLAPPVRFSAVPEVEKNKSIEAGQPIVLQCELSDPTAQVCWYKDGIQLHPKTGIDIKSEGTMRTLIIQSADLSGVYSCKTADDLSEFYVDVKAPLVTFVEMPEENLQKNVVELDPLVLHCELSRPDAATQWYKDGVEIKPGNNIIMKADGTQRQLIIQTTQLSDSGTYTCRAGDNTLLFKVSIREPPVMIVYPKEDVHLDRYVSEEIVLSCELSRQNGTVNWYKDGQKLQESENIKIKSEGPYRRLKILHGTAEDSGEYVCDTADDSIFFQLNITEAPVRIVSPSQSQMELCQQTSERVVLSCELSRANAPVRWYRDGLEVEENDNLILEVDGIYRRLIIPETTVQDSAEYVCDTADDSVTFFVNIAEPPVRFVRPRKMASTVESIVGDPVVLECEVSRASAQVSWKKDGEEMEESRNITIIEDGISRQLTIRSSRLEDSGQYICDAKDDVMDFTVKISEKPVKILSKSNTTEQQFETSEDIVLECELSRANGIAKWYKDGENIVENERFYFEEDGTFRSLVIMNAELTDSGKYVCDVRDDKIVFHVTVKEPPVTILGNSGSPEHHSLLAGDDLILECEVSRASATVDWYSDGKLLSSDSRTHIESYGTVRKLVLSRLQPSDSGTYTCDAIDDKMSTIVKVQETPLKFLDKPESNIITAYEKESVTFNVKVSQDNATLQWLKELKQLTGDRIHTRSEGNTHFLTITDLQRSDSGRYTCDASTDQMHFNLTVKAFRVTFVRPLENTVAQKDGLITLQCELNETKGDVLWLKDGQEITPSCRLAIRAEGRARSLTIRNISERDAGEYTCESKDDRTSARMIVETPRVVEFIAELYNTTVLEGEDATFKCMVSPEDVQVVWYRDGQPITPDERFTVSSNGLCHTVHIHNCQVSDSCRITAMAEGLKSEASLKVQETQVLFTKKMESVKSEEYGEATFVVEVNMEAGEVQWMRQGVVIQSGPKFTLKQVGRKRSLTIHKLSLSDQGMYRCETLHDCTRGELTVEPRKVTIRKRLAQIETFERETASFEVELSHSNVEGVWQKDGVRLKPSNYCRMSTKGCVHSLTVLNLSMEDTGTITFSAGNVGTFARLVVKELPVTIVKKMEDLRLPEGSMASLECELSKQNADVKWLKNGIVVKPDKNHRIYSMGRKRFLQILKCDQSDTGIYTCDAGDTTASCSLDIYERQVEVVHGLEDLDIQEDQNAVFVCEVSVADVPGEWYKNGEEIRPTSTIKIRQEGTKHFLLICNVKAEDSGEIKFVAKQAESIAYLEVEALPMTIVNPLRDTTVVEKSRVVLDCTVSNPRSSIRWYHGNNVVLPSEHFEICSEGCYRKLVIQQVSLEDGGVYSVQVGEHISSAQLTVKACTSN
ncbi:obscurin-like protein 1 isoform X4 [Paramormyrops kingsleyae]|uniref:obscurin-like protein 1 isoform X4 n=1 Tax=Paramormyrops kingsleyae TaxID=1676925 RepID=UPI003B977B4A